MHTRRRSRQSSDFQSFATIATYDTVADEFGPNGYEGGITTGDFDGDGKVDVALTEGRTRKVFLFFGAGANTFVAGPAPIDTADSDPDTQPADVMAGDFNGDGKDDLAIVMANGFNHAVPLMIALSNGAARTFSTTVSHGSFISGRKGLVRDIDGDGKLDVLVPSNDLLLFRGNGDGTLAASQAYSPDALGIAVADFDRDGGPDIVTTAFVAGKVNILLNTCGRVNLTLTSSANPAAQGTAITVTGTLVSPPAAAATGTLTLKRNTTVLNSGNLNAGTVLAAIMNDLSPGTYPLKAEYSGDARYLPATRTLDQVVTVPPFGPPPGMNAISFGGPVQMSWYATSDTHHYEVWRSNGAGWVKIAEPSIAAYTDAIAPSNAALLYRAVAVKTDGTTSDPGNSDLALTYAFTDGTLQPGITKVKLAHLSELRNAANAVRALASMRSFFWADDAPQIIRASHIAELRTVINDARAALALSPLTYTNPTLTVGSSSIRAVHFEELRSAMR